MGEIVIPKKIDGLAEKGYGKKISNRLASTVDQAQIAMVGGAFDGQRLKARHILGDFPSPPVFERGQEGVEFNNRLVSATQALTGPSLDRAYIDGIGGDDYGNLPGVITGLAAGKNEDMVMRTVFGATKEMPLRGLSYLLPSLTIAGDLKERGIEPPQVQFVFANNISSKLGAIEVDKARSESRVFARVAFDYIREFFPELSDSVVFLEDTEIEKGSDSRDKILSVARLLRQNASPERLEELQQRGRNNKAERKAVFYGAAHVLVHDLSSVALLKPIMEDQPDQAAPSTIISVGGLQEKTFYGIRSEARGAMNGSCDTANTLQYFTKHHTPPYYMARGGDRSLGDILSGMMNDVAIARTARIDLNYLRDVSCGRGSLDEFMDQQRKKYEK